MADHVINLDCIFKSGQLFLMRSKHCDNVHKAVSFSAISSREVAALLRWLLTQVSCA